MLTTTRRWPGLLALFLALSVVAAACGDGGEETTGSGESGGGEGELSGEVRVDGSSTVAPLTEAAAELFQEEHPGVRVTVGVSGTGGGFEKFCNGETDVSNASRAIDADEEQACAANGIAFRELTVANDALSVVVSPENDWADCLTVDQLKAIWEPGSRIDNWNQIPDANFPDVPLELFGAGTDSGTFDYFTDAVVGEEGASRTDYNATEDDNVTVQGVSGTRGALGYFGFSYLEENQGAVQGVAIDGGGGCVEPSAEAVQDGSYQPLGRPLFVYPSARSLERPEVQEFLRFYVENSGEIADQALFIPLTQDQTQEAEEKLTEILPR